MSSPWSDEELTQTITRANPFVRHLLWELTQRAEVDASDVKSPNTAFAILSRMAKRASKEPLVQRTRQFSGRFQYSVHPDYRDRIKVLVEDASELPTPQPKRPPVQKPRSSTAGRPRSPGRPRHQKAIVLPSEIGLEFGRDLISFLNANHGEKRFRIVLDGEDLLLEAT